MSKPESTLWKNLREGTKELGVFWTRLESWSSPGVPDLHGILDGHAFWLELKVHRLNSLNKIALRPHQIAWQIRYSRYLGNVWNLVGHPSSRTINIFHGSRAMELTEKRTKDDPLIPDWSSGTPYDWAGAINHILSSSRPIIKEEELQFRHQLSSVQSQIINLPQSFSVDDLRGFARYDLLTMIDDDKDILR